MSTNNSTSKFKCSVPGCETLPTAKYHRIPKRSWRAELWKKAIDSPLLNDLDPEELCKHHVCSSHFDQSDYSLNASRCQLDNHVVPHRNMPGSTSESEPEDKTEYVTFGSIIEGFEEKESNQSVSTVVPEVTEEFHDITETEEGFKVVHCPTVAQLNSVVYWAIPYVPKTDEQMHDSEDLQIDFKVKQIDCAINTKNSIDPIPEKSPDGADVQPIKEIFNAEVQKNKILTRQKGRIQIPLKLWVYIKNLRRNDVSLQRENNLLRRKNLSLAQRLRRASVLLRRTRGMIKSNGRVDKDSGRRFAS